jgi:Fe-Mn family superoxide dismutase
MHQGMPEKYNFVNIAPELSVEMFENHWKLYEGYVTRLNDTLKQLSNPYDPNLLNSAGPAAGRFRELENDKSYLTNAVHLHELFFENVILPDNSAPMIPGPEFTSLVQRDFPHVKSNDFWSNIIKPTAKSARGWCIVGFNTLDAKLDVCMLDSHGGVMPIGLYPILVLDVYEHSYAPQYGIDRGTYLDHMRRSLNWAVVEHRVATIHSASELMRLSVPEEAEEYIKKHLDDDDKDFGFPDEDWFPDQGEPQSEGLDSRNELATQPNPRAHSSVQGAVTDADLDEAFQRIRSLAAISFKSEDDLFDKEATGKSSLFREELWALLHEETN